MLAAAKRGDDMTRDFPDGNYRFIPAVFQFSSGNAASPDFEIERVRFDTLLPLADGFARASHYIQPAFQITIALATRRQSISNSRSTTGDLAKCQVRSDCAAASANQVAGNDWIKIMAVLNVRVDQAHRAVHRQRD